MARQKGVDLGLTEVERGTLHDQIYNQLRRALMSGKMRPGQLLSHRGLAKELGTSPMPVRDAVRRLIAERILEPLPNRTIAVPNLSIEQIEEIYKIRIILEGAAAEEAASKIRDADIKELKVLEDEMEAYERSGDFQNYSDMNWRFHFKIYRAAQLPQLTSMIETLWLQVGPLIAQEFAPSLFSPDRGPRADYIYRVHRRTIDALAKRDGDAARAGIVDDLEGARVALRTALAAAESAEESAAPDPAS